MPTDTRTPYAQVLMWAFNLTTETIEPLESEFPQLGIKKKEALFGDIYQGAVIVASLIRIERHLGKHDYTKLHNGILQSIHISVRSRFIAAIHGLSSFLLDAPHGSIPADTIPAFDSLHEKTESELEALIGLWIAWSLIGKKPILSHELHFTSAIGRLAFSQNAKFIASVFLSDKSHIERYV